MKVITHADNFDLFFFLNFIFKHLNIYLELFLDQIEICDKHHFVVLDFIEIYFINLDQIINKWISYN